MSTFHIREHQVPSSHIREYPRATADNQEAVLHLAVKQYTPQETYPATHAVTIIGAHANGFPKELYEPLWDDLLSRFKLKGIRIRDIWIADVAHQGASGVLNEDVLGNDPSWMDHPRDLFLMVNHFRAEMQRPIIGIGHSMGGNNLVNLALIHPRLFTTLILADPVIQRTPPPDDQPHNPAKSSTRRRDRWPSRTVAATAFKKNRFYQTWDPRVLDKWIQYGLRDLPTKLYPRAKLAPISAVPDTVTVDASSTSAVDKEVTLTTTKHQEVLSFLRAHYPTVDNPFPSFALNADTHPDADPNSAPIVPFYRPEPGFTFSRLPNLRPSVLYLFGDQSAMSAPILKADKMANTGVGPGGSGGFKKGRVAEVTFKGIGHLIPMEAVEQSADAITSWVTPELARWSDLESRHDRQWKAVPSEEKSIMSQDFQRYMAADWATVLREERLAWEKTKPKL